MLKAIYLLLILALASTPVRAERPLVFAVIDDVPSTPMAVAILEQAYGQLGVSIETLSVPSSRALMMANTGAIDGDLFRIAEVKNDFSNLIQVPYPLLRGRLDVITLDPNIKTWDTKALKGKRVGLRRGVIVAERTAAGMRQVQVGSYLQLLRLLEHGRIDVALVSDIEGASPAHSPAWQNARTLEQPARHFTLHHYLTKTHADKVQPLSEALQAMDESGETAAIIERYRETVPES